MARAITIENLHPSEPGTFLVLIADPESASDRTVTELGNRAYEGERAFYVSNTDAWFERRQDRVRIWRARPDEQPELLHETSIMAPARETGPTLLIVYASGSLSVEAALAPIRSGESWPVILGPA